MIKFTFYIICQTDIVPTDCLEILKADLPCGNSVVFQTNTLNAAMKRLLQYLCDLIPHSCVQYLPEDMVQDIAREDRQFLFALERTGTKISVERDSSVGKSFYARRRRHQHHIKNADYVLIIYDEMTTEIRNAIKYAEANAVAYKVICCANSDEQGESYANATEVIH
ncbi:hypothetical protein D7X33_19750 [Butyricicoccus sp. 1XD8-22]|nr:hypothetical protein D7X33_19750 [Butyricicoccus sp. 1XD8-22]